MKDLILQKQKLCKKSIILRTAKFDTKISRETVSRLIEEQDKVYKHYKFYDEYIKAINKEKRKEK